MSSTRSSAKAAPCTVSVDKQKGSYHHTSSCKAVNKNTHTYIELIHKADRLAGAPTSAAATARDVAPALVVQVLESADVRPPSSSAATSTASTAREKRSVAVARGIFNLGSRIAENGAEKQAEKVYHRPEELKDDPQAEPRPVALDLARTVYKRHCGLVAFFCCCFLPTSPVCKSHTTNKIYQNGLTTTRVSPWFSASPPRIERWCDVPCFLLLQLDSSFLICPQNK